MAWDKLHKVVSVDNAAGGGLRTETCQGGYWSETIALPNGASSAASSVTSNLPFPMVGDFTVIVKFAVELGTQGGASPGATDTTIISVEHSHDGVTYTGAGHSGTTDQATTDLTGGEDSSVLMVIDHDRQDEATNGVYFTYNIDDHGMSNYIRFKVTVAKNENANTATFHAIPHNI